MAIDKFKSELAEDRRIDPEQLDIEVARQADAFFNWAERAVYAKAALERAEESLASVEATLQLRCRELPDTFGLKNVSEAGIKAAVRLHPDYAAASQAYLTAKMESSWLDKAVVTMDMKKRMLEAMIDLHGQQYFAGPSVPRDLVSIWQSRTSEAGSRQKAAARRRKVEE